MKVSIITITYNSAATLPATLASVARQDYAEIEHILVDGNSTDGSQQILSAYAAQRSHVHYISEQDNGIYDAINKGIRRATGDIIGILNSDDVLASPEVISHIVHAFQSAQEGINFEDFAKNNAYEAQFIVKETYAFWFDFFDKIDETNKYISSNIQAQIKQQLSVLNGIRDWGYSNAEQDYFTKEIDRVIQEQTAGIENDEEIRDFRMGDEPFDDFEFYQFKNGYESVEAIIQEKELDKVYY